MSARDERFRRLKPSTRRNGDLFEHFGVAVEPAGVGSLEQVPVQAVHACPTCGWYADPSTRCDNCGEEAKAS